MYFDHAFHVWKWKLMQVLRVQIPEHHQFLLGLALHYLPQLWSKHPGQKTKYQLETGKKISLKDINLKRYKKLNQCYSKTIPKMLILRKMYSVLGSVTSRLSLVRHIFPTGWQCNATSQQQISSL